MQKWQAGRPRNAAKRPAYDQIVDGYEQQYLEMVAGDLITCLVSLSWTGKAFKSYVYKPT